MLKVKKIDVSKCESLKSHPKNISDVEAVLSLVGVVHSLMSVLDIPTVNLLAWLRRKKGK